MKKDLVLLMVLAIALTCSGNLWAARDLDPTATVIKIKGNEITLRGDKGEVFTVKNDPIKIRIGQTVKLQNGRIVNTTLPPAPVQETKTGEPGPGNPIGINPQPEPPGKNSSL